MSFPDEQRRKERRLSASRLAPPVEWRPRPTWRLALLAVCVILPSALAGVYGLVELATGFTLHGGVSVTGVSALALAAWLPLATVHMWHRMYRRKPSVDSARSGADHEAPALLIRYSRSGRFLRLIVAVVLAVGSLPLAGAAWASGHAFLCALMGLLGLAGAWGVGHQLHAGLQPGELSLSPKKIRLRADGNEYAAMWDDVRLVVAWEYQTDKHGFGVHRWIQVVADNVVGWQRPHRWTTRGRAPLADQPGIAVECDAIAIDSVRLYHLLCFYHQNPRSRAELGTRQSFVRLRDGLF